MTRDPSRQPDDRLPEVSAALEDRLRGLPWREPDASLDARVTAALAGAMGEPASYPLPWVRRWSAAAAVLLLAGGVMVAVALLTGGPQDESNPLAVADPPPSGTMPASSPEAARIEQVWLSAEPTGQWVFDDGRALEAVRVVMVKQVSFEDEDGVAYDVAVPIEQVMYVPASYE